MAAATDDDTMEKAIDKIKQKALELVNCLDCLSSCSGEASNQRTIREETMNEHMVKKGGREGKNEFKRKRFGFVGIK